MGVQILHVNTNTYICTLTRCVNILVVHHLMTRCKYAQVHEINCKHVNAKSINTNRFDLT